MVKSTCAASVFAMIAGPAFTDDLTITQSALAQQMYETVLERAVISRMVDMCAEITVNEAQFAARRDHIMSLAQQNFSSGEEFMRAAGVEEQEKMGEDMRRFFFQRGVKWTSSAEEYCELAHTLIEAEAHFATHLETRE